MLISADIGTIAVPGVVAVVVALIGYFGIRLQVQSKLASAAESSESTTSKAIAEAKESADVTHRTMLDGMANAVAMATAANERATSAETRASAAEQGERECERKYAELKELVTNELAGRERRRQEAGAESNRG